MPRKGHIEEQILQALRQAEGGEKAAEKVASCDEWVSGQSQKSARIQEQRKNFSRVVTDELIPFQMISIAKGVLVLRKTL